MQGKMQVSLLLLLCVLTKTEVITQNSAMGSNNVIATDVDLIWPFEQGNEEPNYPFSSPFGPRLKASSSYRYDYHRGIDIPRTNGTQLRAVQDGKIFRARYSGSGDLYIALRVYHSQTIKDLTGYKYFYAIYRHLKQLNVVEGDYVNKGDIIAYSGESDSGFDHLHFDIAQGGSWETNNTHPLFYFDYPNTGIPAVSKVNASEDYVNPQQKQVTFRVTVDSSELDLVEVSVSGSLGNTDVEGVFNLVTMNKITYNKPDLDNAEQTLSNGVVVTVSPHSHNSSNTECIIDFVFDFSSVVNGGVSNYAVEIKAKDVRDGYTTINVVE